MSKPITYAFKDFIVNGMGADLVRLIKILYYCNKNNLILHLLGKDDKWLLVPEKSDVGQNWLYYYEPSIPIDNNGLYPHITENYLEEADNIKISETEPFEHFSFLLKSIYKPNREMLYKKNKLLEKFNFLNSGNYIAIHIRRGDKTSGPWREGNIIQLDEYLDSLRTILDRTPSTIKYVYIATDSDEVINEIQTKKLPNITFIYDFEENRRDGYVYKLYKKSMNDIDKEDEIITFMKNIDLLVGAYEIIGSRMSFFFIVAELLRGKKGISLSNNLFYPVNFY